MTLSDLFSTMIARIAGSEKDEEFPRHRPPLERPIRKISEESSFLARMGQTLAQHQAVSAGHVNFIDLGPLQTHFGDRWPEVEARVRQLVEAELERRLQPGDVFFNTKGLSYLVLFAGLDGDEARLRAALLGRELTTALLGTAAEADLIHSHAVALKENGEPVAGEINDLQQLVTTIFQAQPLLSASAAGTGRSAAPGRSGTGGTGRSMMENSRQDKGLSGIGFLHYPMWNVRNRVVSVYHCLPARVDRHGVLHTGYAVLRDHRTPKHISQLDIRNLRHAQSLIRARAGAPVAVGTLVHFETLATQRRRQLYIQACAQMDRLLGRLLLIELVGVPRGVPFARLFPLVGALRPHCRAVIARFSLEKRNFESLAGTGLMAVGTEIGKSRDSERRQLTLMNRFCAAAESAGLSRYVFGVPTPSLVSGAVCAGFNYIAGPAIVSPGSNIVGILPFHLSDIYGEKCRTPSARDSEAHPAKKA